MVAFDRPGSTVLDSGFNLGEIVRVTVASAAWTSGQHWNALTPAGIALYVAPVLLAVGVALARVRPQISSAALAWISFACAQAFNVISCVLARRAGNPVPVGGKEGWYWYVLAPILIATVIAPLMDRDSVRRYALLAFAWVTVWDIVITEGALFAGASESFFPVEAAFRALHR